MVTLILGNPPGIPLCKRENVSYVCNSFPQQSSGKHTTKRSLVDNINIFEHYLPYYVYLDSLTTFLMAYSSASTTLINKKNPTKPKNSPSRIKFRARSQLSYPTKQLAVGEYDPLDWAGLTISTDFCWQYKQARLKGTAWTCIHNCSPPLLSLYYYQFMLSLITFQAHIPFYQL